MWESYRLYAVGVTASMHELLPGLTRLALILLALAATLPCLYLLLLTLLSAALPLPRRSARTLRFDVIVPAHDEAPGIGRTIANLLQLDWPRLQFRVLVVADNCTDSTAEVARAAGAEVLIRNDANARGKGYALAYAFDYSVAAPHSDAVVIVDADSEVSANLLEAFAVRLEEGASAVQAHYGVLNPHDSWRTRLMAIALGAFHMLRSRARERLRVSCGIRGNGWCVTQALLRQVPYRAFSLTEDIEFGIELGITGQRVVYAEEARVDGEMVTNAQSARSQRQRWEAGRFRLICLNLPRLIRATLRQRSLVCMDLALDLLVLPLSYVILGVLLYAFTGALGWLMLGEPRHLLLALIDFLVLALYVLRGWQLSNVGPRGLLDLARAPAFVAWKLLLLFAGRRPRQWIRTERERS